MSTETQKYISNKYCRRFGQTAVEMDYITADELKEAINIQVDEDISGNEHRLLGAILFEKNRMSSAEIETVLNLMLKKMRADEE